jgi:hypothetical protein
MSFSTDLDKYLTTPPEDNDAYYEAVYDCMAMVKELKDFDWDKNQDIIDSIIDGCAYCYNPNFDAEQTATFISLMLKMDLIKGIDY